MGHEFQPWSRKIPHATVELSPRTTTTKSQLLKPAYLEPMLHNNTSHTSEKPTHRNKK